MTPSDFITQICIEENIDHKKFSGGYVHLLKKNSETRRVFGSYWDINSAAADRIACDKAACSALLAGDGVPAISHELIFNPLRRAGWAGANGAWAQALSLFEKYNRRVVLKPNQGTKGQDVYFCDTISTFETAAQAIFATEPDAAISPYHEIENEYRVFYLNGECRLAYGKTRGDTWQHNLSQGAIAFDIAEAKKETARQFLFELHNLAARAAECIGINFATVDIAEAPDGGLVVMEINSGIQAGQLLNQLPHFFPTVKNIYKDAIRLMFNVKLIGEKHG